jgi:hypothetical protein
VGCCLENQERLWQHANTEMFRKTAITAKPLAPAERKSSMDRIAAQTTGKARDGMKLIDLREPTAKERAFAETLVPKAKEILARGARRAAA